jgi:hypothetical protein
MDKRVYEFLIFQDKTLIYYIDPQQFEKEVNYSELQNSHRIRNLESTSATMSHFIRILHPSIKTQAKNFKTKEYQLSLLETANNVKFVLVTSVQTQNDNASEEALTRLYDNYINLVKRNYLYRPGELVRVARFEEEVRKILKTLE